VPDVGDGLFVDVEVDELFEAGVRGKHATGAA
jgi:hypothetical protein